MAVQTKVESLEKDIQIILSEELSQAAMSAKFAEFAQEQITEIDDINRQVLGRIPPRTVYVDGREGADLRSVRPDGNIVAEWQLLSDLIVWIGEQLIKFSPRLTGRYQKSHTLFADGVEVEIGAQVPEASEYVFISPLPYARKIEGTDTKPPESKQAPNGVYRLVAQMAQSENKFRGSNSVRVVFTYRTAIGTSIFGGKFGNRSEHRNPAIVVTVK